MLPSVAAKLQPKTNLSPLTQPHLYTQQVRWLCGPQHTHRLVAFSSFPSSSGLSHSSSGALTALDLDLLDRYWTARGVIETEQRTRLLDIAQTTLSRPDANNAASTPFAGSMSVMTATWVDDAATEAQVAELSRRLISLNSALGGRDRDVDVVWMVLREPELLLSDSASIIERLLELRTSAASEGIDIGKLVEDQPGLLLQDKREVKQGADETASEQRDAWQHGLLSDSSSEWQRRLQQLSAYKSQYRDAHVGCRDGEDPELVRWAKKQRKAYKYEELETEKIDLLQGMGFEFDEEKAEWLRWYNELQAFQEEHGHSSPMPLASGTDFLINWCAIQRIAQRSKVLTSERKDLLDNIEFDWTGADALS